MEQIVEVLTQIDYTLCGIGFVLMAGVLVTIFK